MARRRMIDPNIWQSEDVAKLTIRQRLLLIGLFSNADDEGKIRGTPAFIRSTIFPYDDFTLNEISEDLNAIEKIGTTLQYEVDGSKYILLINWEKFQRVDKPQPSLIPDPIEDDSKIDSRNESKNDSDTDSKSDSSVKEKKGKEEKVIPFLEIVSYLNQKAKTSYRHTTKRTKELIKARWNEGFLLEDFQRVIEIKTTQWINDPKMVQYLRPETLFGTKFESYLNQLPPQPKDPEKLPFEAEPNDYMPAAFWEDDVH